ncbi:MAG: 2-amino-4-hydroxy-6-hydroxymethyldihydropteridine diphosphokinase [Paenibacillaceae bacterium ZCTH02-B3]|mgnify:FL=1|nr:MAG: 2-amino-4-hydroxy-6-hydroxymethyldihydropteridine diphosphokinase [Paenibacillaceae bacterium ZCTH02-B3]
MDAVEREAYIGLGANLGDREAALREAVRLLDAAEGVRVLRVSPVYETDPVGYTDQPEFLNMAVAVGTTLSPEGLLALCLGIERRMGRVRTIRWGPRPIDLDLLAYDGVRMETERLTLPHPRLAERAFALVPLRDVWPEGRAFPWTDAPALREPDGVRLWKSREDFWVIK